MGKAALELADIFRRHGEDYRTKYGSHMSPEQHRVMRAIAICRTAALGGHVDACDHCGHRVVSYNSCRNRHCPKCQALAKAKWLQARRAELLPVPYYHVIFTLPQSLAPLAQQNKRVVYNILFQTVSQTLLTLAADPKHLGAEIGFLAILHTWGQTLLTHPHVHCVVPGGGLTHDRQKWGACRERFFLPVSVLSRLFRRLFLDRLQKAFAQGRLEFHGDIQNLAQPAAFDRFLQTCRRTNWVVYAKPPFGGPEKVLDYLARYTHRIAISNHRLLTLEEGNVSFTWRDYKHGGTRRTMTVDAHEFIRRFLLHVLPSGFVRVRYYGLLANRYRTQKLQLCRTLLEVPEPADSQPVAQQDWADLLKALTGVDPLACPQCKEGRMVRVEILPPSPPFCIRSPPRGQSP